MGKYQAHHENDHKMYPILVICYDFLGIDSGISSSIF